MRKEEEKKKQQLQSWTTNSWSIIF